MEQEQLFKIREAIIELDKSQRVGKTPRLQKLVKEFEDLNDEIKRGN